jgi:hypothetical protein
VKFVRTKRFLKCLKRLGATEDDLGELEQELAANPETGDVIPGLGGVRKVRFALGGKGKRGGGRAIYLAIKVADVTYLLLAYSKSEQEALTEIDKKVLKTLAKELKDAHKKTE